MNELVERYLSGESSVPLAQEYGVTPATMRRKLLKAGVVMRPRGGKRKLSLADEANVVEQFLAGEKQEYLAALYGVTRRTLCRTLERAGAVRAARWIEGIHIVGAIAVKRCSSCWVTRPLADFHDDSSKRDGMRSNCRYCATTST